MVRFGMFWLFPNGLPMIWKPKFVLHLCHPWGFVNSPCVSMGKRSHVVGITGPSGWDELESKIGREPIG